MDLAVLGVNTMLAFDTLPLAIRQTNGSCDCLQSSDPYPDQCACRWQAPRQAGGRVEEGVGMCQWRVC